MEDNYKACLWRNFAASIDMLTNVIELCPNALWEKKDKFFYMAYHTVIFLDYYLTYPVRAFDPKLPFTIVPDSELPSEAVDDVMPDRHYGREEMIAYIHLARKKGEDLIGPQASQDLMVKWIEQPETGLHGLCPSLVEHYTLLEILFYNFRHVQHHVAQLNYILRGQANLAAEWISQAE
jgi:hypothetical protein